MNLKIFFMAVACLASSTVATAQYTLNQVVDSALHNNIAISDARHNIETARLSREEAHSKYFPNISATAAGFAANKGIMSMDMNLGEMIPAELATALSQSMPGEALAKLSNPTSMSLMKNGALAGVTAMQPVYAGGRIVNANKLARVGEDVSYLQLQLSENEVEHTAEQYFWQLATLQEKMKTIKTIENLLADLNKDATVAIDAGVALRNDLLQVELRQNEVESQRLKLVNGISVVKLLLAQYCGLADTTFSISYQVDAVEPPLAYRRNHNEALATTPEYRLLCKQVEAASLQEKITLGENLPSVAVGADLNYTYMMEKSRAFGIVFATVSIPISNWWWGGSQSVKRKKIEHLQAVEQQADNAELLNIRMDNAWNGVEEAYQQLLLAQRSIEQAEENLRLNRDYYHAGTSTMSDLLEAQMLYQQSMDKRIEAYADYQNKILEYKQSTGQKTRYQNTLSTISR